MDLCYLDERRGRMLVNVRVRVDKPVYLKTLPPPLHFQSSPVLSCNGSALQGRFGKTTLLVHKTIMKIHVRW